MCCCCCLFFNDIIVPNIKWVIWYYVAYTVYNAKNRRTETAYNIWWLLVVSLSMINCAGGCREAINASNNRTERRKTYPIIRDDINDDQKKNFSCLRTCIAFDFSSKSFIMLIEYLCDVFCSCIIIFKQSSSFCLFLFNQQTG
jgi:hypothetical protein